MRQVDAVAILRDALRDRGWVEDGETPVELVRIGSARAPIYSGIGGTNARLGGRARFHLPDTAWYLTLGPRTTFIYTKSDGKVASGQSFKTVETNVVLDFVDALAGLGKLDTRTENGEQMGARDRELLGRLVREVWVAYCVEIGDTKPSHLASWDELTEEEREVDRRIGERLFDEGVAALARAKLGLNVWVENDVGPSRPIYLSVGSTTPAPLDTNE